MPHPAPKRGRPRSIDPALAMAAIVETFRDKGYAATSLDDLTAATGLSRPSLYRAFGDKLAMYLAAMDAFGADATRLAAPALTAGSTAEQALSAFYDAMLDIYFRDAAVAPGCLVFATAPCGADNDIIRTRLKSGIESVDTLFRTSFENHAAAASGGQIQTAVEIASNTLFALSTRAKSGASRAELSAMGHRVAKAIGVFLQSPEDNGS